MDGKTRGLRAPALGPPDGDYLVEPLAAFFTASCAATSLANGLAVPFDAATLICASFA